MIENTLKDWSYKKLKMYRACPYSVYLKYIKREPEASPNPKYEEKRQRGIVLHEQLAETINEGARIPRDALKFSEIIESYIDLGAVAEGDEYFDRQWKAMTPQFSANGYPFGHWLVVKKDVRIRTPEFSLIADWKTGKKYGNELDHYEQGKLYAVTEWINNPGLPEYIVEIQYIDEEDTWSLTFKLREMEKHWRTFEADIDIMFNDSVFRPKPNIHTCRYCPFNNRSGSGACPVAAV